MSPFKLASLSLSRHKFTTIITVISIALSVACGGILLRLYKLSDSRFSTLGRGSDAIVGAKAGGIDILLGSLNGEGAYPDFLPYKLFQSLRADQKVVHEDGTASQPNYIETIIPFLYFAKFDQYRVVGTDESFTSNGTKLSNGQWFKSTDEIVIGSTVASEKNIKAGDKIKINPWTGKDVFPSDIELTVSGILASTKTQWDHTLFASLDLAQGTFAKYPSLIEGKSIWGTDVLNYFLIYLKPNGFVGLEALINKRTVAQVIRIDEQIDRLKDISGVGKSIGLFVTSFVIILGGLSVGSMLVTRFEGMSLQLAVLRALGYTKNEISKWLLWEGLLLGIMGVFIGAIIDYLGFPVLRSLLGNALPSADLVSSSLFESSMIWFIAIVAVMISVFIPVIRMSRQDIHDSLKGL